MVASFLTRVGAFTPAAGGLDGSESDGTQLLAGNAAMTTDWIVVQAEALGTNSVLAPNGATDGATFQGNGTDDRHLVYQSLAPNLAAQTFSIYAKQNTVRYLQLLLAGDGKAWVYADLQTGTITDDGDSGTNTTLTSSDIAVGANGYYKISMTIATVNVTHYYQVALSDVATYGAPLVSDSPQFTTSGGVYLWRPKLVAA